MDNKKINITVLVSGGGTNLQALIDAAEAGRLPGASINRIISSSHTAYALERGKKHGIATCVVSGKDFPDEEKRNEKLLEELRRADTDLIVLAGYMKVLSPVIIKAYEGRIVNIHPSLIPKYCGRGFYGIRVHEAVIAAGEKESGATVHFVDEGVDTGEIIMQKKVPVLPGDTPESLAARVLETEHEILEASVGRVVADLQKRM
ncbi:MAG: phosphoribosylglycinamide formyltransferase [Clostridia bacterium]|nr:phosphoribosylglycinamide formyltransferase [Clostridia bacterium]